MTTDETNLPGVIERVDDGSVVLLDSYAGGGHRDGPWSHLTLRFRAANGDETTRTYTADDVAPPPPFADCPKIGGLFPDATDAG
jgi:hypothetical protein